MAPLRIQIDGRIFRDNHGREVTLRGINVAGDAKLPSKPDLPSYQNKDFFDGDNVSFVGRPFAVEEADEHFSRLKRWGYNAIRFIFTWEAIEHAGPGRYDEEWIDHTIHILRLAKNYGFYVWLDPHQDVWSRFTGGSGAPMWTLYAVGLNPQTLAKTQAALVQNTWPRPADFPKMIWATNYTRLACQVLFTLFFAGKDFAPKAVIDGVNIQVYLQNHFIAACGHLAKRIRDAGDLSDDVVIGWESMNEPNRGLVGWQDLTVIPEEQKLQQGPSPTAWQAILTGSGRACEEDTWEFGALGPYKSGTEVVDPEGETAWLPADYDDSRYGWKRDPSWKLGECIWAQHGIWDPASDQIRKKDYFARDSKGRKIDYEYFTNHYFVPYYRNYKRAILAEQPGAIMLCQPPVLEIPPSIKGTEDDDSRMVFAPHFYDGITLMMKKWNRYWNVDVFGILRGRYLTPAFAIKLGETAIRNCFRDQLSAIRQEGLDYMGEHPCIFTEIGIPFDMNNKSAYKTGDYSSQSSAMDANHYALEGSGVNGFALWLYMSTNNHAWGDLWNGEDLSIYSVDDRPLPQGQCLYNGRSGPLPHPNSIHSDDKNSPSFSESRATDLSNGFPDSIKQALTGEPSILMREDTSHGTRQVVSSAPSSSSFRAAEAFVRPSPIVTVGKIENYSFDLRNCIFNLSLNSPSAATDAVPTEVFLPDFHFPQDRIDVQISSGQWSLQLDDVHVGIMQRFRWVHGKGKQKLRIKGVTPRQGRAFCQQEEEGYLPQCRQQDCRLM